MFDGTTIAWQLKTSTSACVGDDGTENGRLDVTIDWKLTPTAAEVVDGVYAVTAAKGTATTVNVAVDEGVGCGPVVGDTSTGVGDLDVKAAK